MPQFAIEQGDDLFGIFCGLMEKRLPQGRVVGPESRLPQKPLPPDDPGRCHAREHEHQAEQCRPEPYLPLGGPRLRHLHIFVEADQDHEERVPYAAEHMKASYVIGSAQEHRLLEAIGRQGRRCGD